MKRSFGGVGILVTLVLSPLLATECFVHHHYDKNFHLSSQAGAMADDSKAITLNVTQHQETEQIIFTESLSEELADQVRTQLNLPLPDPLVTVVLARAIESVSKELSPKTMELLQEVLQAEGTASGYDDIDDFEPLARQIAQEINPKMDIAFVKESDEEEILFQIIRIMLELLSSSSVDRQKEFVDQQFWNSRQLLLGGPGNRQALVDSWNAAVDLPFLDEAKEADLMAAALNACADALEQLLPPDVIETLKGESPGGIMGIKTYLIERVNSKVDLIGFNEEQEAALIKAIVDSLLDAYVDETEIEFVILDQKEQEQLIIEKCVLLNRDLELSRRRFEREQAAIQARIDRLQVRLSAIQKKEM